MRVTIELHRIVALDLEDPGGEKDFFFYAEVKEAKVK